ncbi:MAG: hypothetical protein WC943_10120 [Elusimicrobiota bacterium]|jgi:hypothetical protein
MKSAARTSLLGLLLAALPGPAAARNRGTDPLSFITAPSMAPGDAARVRGALRRSLRSQTARGLAQRFTEASIPLETEFAGQPRDGLWATQRTDSGTAVVSLAPMLARAPDGLFARAFWHEACHALSQAEADSAGIRLWDLFFDDELRCYLAGEVVRLELGGSPDIDEMSAAMSRSTEAFAAAMLLQESNASLTWEELGDPMAAWRRRKESLSPLKEHAAEVLKRVPVWRCRVREVVEAGLIAPARLETVGYELDASERTRGGFDDILELEKSLDRRLAFFGSEAGASDLERLRGSAAAGPSRNAHEEMVVLQARYRILARTAKPHAGPLVDGGGTDDGPSSQADWGELQKAYETLKQREPSCCGDEPQY